MTLIRIAFELTTRCNLNCKHCLRERGEGRHDLPVEVLEKVLRQGKDAYGLCHTAFTGGEPLMYPHLEKAVSLMEELDYYFSIVTNGHLLPKKLGLLTSPEIKKRFTNVCISLDGADEAVHDSIRGEGSFRKALAALVLAKNAGIMTVIKYTVGRHNFKTIERDLLELSHLKADRIEIAHTHPTPENLEAGLVLDPAECREFEAAVYRMAEELKTPVLTNAGVYTPQKFYSCSSLDMQDFYVDSKGRLCVCCMLPGIRGRDREKDEPDVVADLGQTDLWEAHKKLLDVIGGLKRDRVERIGKGNLCETDHFQCIACARHFGKLEWMSEFPDNPWNRPCGEEDADG